MSGREDHRTDSRREKPGGAFDDQRGRVRAAAAQSRSGHPPLRARGRILPPSVRFADGACIRVHPLENLEMTKSACSRNHRVGNELELLVGESVLLDKHQLEDRDQLVLCRQSIWIRRVRVLTNPFRAAHVPCISRDCASGLAPCRACATKDLLCACGMRRERRIFTSLDRRTQNPRAR